MPRKSKSKTEPSVPRHATIGPAIATICAECRHLRPVEECAAHLLGRDFITGEWYYENAYLVNDGQCPDFEHHAAGTTEIAPLPPDRTPLWAAIWLAVLTAAGVTGWLYWGQIRGWLGL